MLKKMKDEIELLSRHIEVAKAVADAAKAEGLARINN